MPVKVVKVKDVKAADPGLAFVLYTEDQSSFDSTLKVTVTIEDTVSIGGPTTTHKSEVHITNKVVVNELDFIVPFGDANWQNGIILQEKLQYTITVEFLSDPPGGGHSDPPSADVFPEQAEFVVTTTPVAGPQSALTHFINAFRVLFGLEPI